MSKEKVSIVYRVRHLFIYHPWLKILSFILAIIVWHYARDEINRFNY